MRQSSIQEGWRGFLSFSFVDQNGRTVIKDKQHLGPLMIQRPHYQEKNRPSVLIIHPPGGVAGGDSLELNVHFKAKSKAMISTPSATKFYRSDNRLATQTQTITVADSAEIEWLPQETLFFNHAIVTNKLKFILESANNRLIAWDIVGLGRPVSGEGFEQGQLTQSLELWIDTKLVFIDRLKITNHSDLLKGSAGLASHSLFATSLFYCNDSASQKTLLQALQAVNWSVSVGVTQLDRLVVMRILADELDEVKSTLFEAWTIARPFIFEVPVVRPRIWNT